MLKISRRKIVNAAVGLFVVSVILVMDRGTNGGGKELEQRGQIKSAPTSTMVTAKDVQRKKKEWGYPVVRVVDGDTIKVDMDGTTTTVRLIGIDTPEVVDPRKPVQCFGREASAKAKEILQGKRVVLVSDETQSNVDKYKRLLRYVILEDGSLFNEYMIKEGYAHEYTYQVPYIHQQRFKEAQRYARENKKGLWADGVCGINATSTKAIY